MILQRKTDELLFKSARTKKYQVSMSEIDLVSSSEVIVNVRWQQGEWQCLLWQGGPNRWVAQVTGKFVNLHPCARPSLAWPSISPCDCDNNNVGKVQCPRWATWKLSCDYGYFDTWEALQRWRSCVQSNNDATVVLPKTTLSWPRWSKLHPPSV